MLDFSSILTAAGMTKVGEIILADLTMAGDNVMIMGTLASGLPERDRRRVILLGVAMALVFLIAFALVATQLLQIPGLILLGGLLLFWVAWKMWRDISADVAEDDGAESGAAGATVHGVTPKKSFLQAAIQITIADLSMSLDNVLLVASIAKDNPALLVIGLCFSVMIMGLASNYVARLVQRFPWIAYIGLVVIIWVAGHMVYEGLFDPDHGVLKYIKA